MARGASVSKLTTPMKFAAGAALLVIVAVAYFVVFYGDLANSIQAAQQQERELRGKLTEARKLEFSYQKDVAELTERQQRQSELKKILPTETEYPSFLSALQGVANVSGVSLVAWTPQPESNAEFYARVPMKLELEGRYHQVAKFFYGVGQLERIINMENISLTRPTRQGGDYIVSVSVLATAFRALAQEATPKSDKRPRGRAAGGKKK
ncbi:MAG: type 4a pilus biogenesis protein PilO [Polyangiaceae bacterium]|nr:type 4a pilus biogenesis protein PilO [Polyangiaceae bacterium]